MRQSGHGPGERGQPGPPSPPRGSRLGSGFGVGQALVGREQELAAIGTAFDFCRGGGGAVVVVRGQPGIGKTRVLEAAAQAANDMETMWLSGHEADVELPFVALADALRPYHAQLGALAPRDRNALESAIALDVAAQLKPLAIQAAFVALCSNLSETRPLLVLVDDAHWLDSATVDVLLFLGRRISNAGMAMLVATRERSDDWQTLRSTELELAGLALAETGRLLASMDHFSEAVVRRLHDATGGNPLALLTIPTLMSAAQRVGAEPLAEPLRSGDALERALLRRIAALSANARAALVVLAAATSEDAGEIAAALQSDHIGADRLGIASLVEAEQAGVVRLEAGRATFVHPLWRSVLYHSATREEQRAAHRALAGALAGGGDRARRALHLAEATIEPDESVAAELVAAATELTQRGAQPEAGLFLERAAALSPAREDRAARLTSASDAVRERGDMAHAAALAEGALELADSASMRADAEAALGRALMATGPMDRAAELLASAALAVDDRLEAARRLIDAAEAAFTCGDDHRGRELALRARPLLGPEHTAERLAIMAFDAFAQLVSGEGGDTSRVIDLLLTNAEATEGDQRVAAAVAQLLLFAGRYDDAAHYCRRVAARARADGRLAMLVDTLRSLTNIEARLGRFTDAAATGAEALLLAEGAGLPAQMAVILNDVAECAAWRGDEDAFQEHASAGDALAARLDIRSIAGSYARARGMLALGLGRLPEALDHLEQALAEECAQHPDRVHTVRVDLVELQIRLGQEEYARGHSDAFGREIERFDSPSLSSMQARCQGLLANSDEFDVHFQRALALHDQIEDRSIQAMNLLAYGRTLRRAQRRGDARTHLRAAAEIFQSCGAWPWLEQARAELRAAGGAAFRASPQAGDPLTPQEYQIARLATTGATNREIAATLFLSVKTVEAHLSRVYGKLGIKRRTALASRMAV